MFRIPPAREAIAIVSALLSIFTRLELAGQELSTARYTVIDDLSYSDASPELRLDLFVPHAASDNDVPCIIVIQGGGFRAQDGQRFRPFAEAFAENGFAAALISYRGNPEHGYKDTVADTKAAVRFIRRVSEEHQIDPERIGAFGRSAGATLAALLAFTGGEAELEGSNTQLEISSRIQAAAGIAGVYDFVARFTDPEQMALQANLDAKRVSNGNWIGSDFASNNEDWFKASANTHIDANDPPMLLLHSRDDPVVPWMQSQNLYEQLRQFGLGAEIMITEHGGHAGPKDSKAAAIAFFQKAL